MKHLIEKFPVGTMLKIGLVTDGTFRVGWSHKGRESFFDSIGAMPPTRTIEEALELAWKMFVDDFPEYKEKNFVDEAFESLEVANG